MNELEVADFIAERMKEDPKIKKIIADVRLFDGLREHKGWKRLFEKARSDKERFLVSLSRRLMSGEKVSTEEINYHRGFYQGAIWVLMHPEVAEQNLERAARMAWALTETELQKQQEEETPYAR